MKVIVKARHMTLTPALKAFAEEKLGDALARIFDRPAAKMEIELTDNGNVSTGSKECRATVTMPHGNPITISEAHDDMYSAINLAHDRLLEQVKRERGKRRDNTRSRKESEERRHQTARDNLTSEPEKWEEEVMEFEQSEA
jgi:ribosomal subunit interface protein